MCLLMLSWFFFIFSDNSIFALLAVTTTTKKLGLTVSLYPWAGYQFNSTAPTGSWNCRDTIGVCLLITNVEVIKKFQNKCFKTSFLPFLLPWTGLHPLTPSCGFEWWPPQQTGYITKLIPHPTHFNPEDGGNMFLWNTHIHPQGYRLQSRRPQSEASIQPPNLYTIIWHLLASK
jgi:hypothetical protein